MPPSSILRGPPGEPQNVRMRLDDAENGPCNILLVLLTRAGRAQYEVVGSCQSNSTDDDRAAYERSGALLERLGVHCSDAYLVGRLGSPDRSYRPTKV